MLGRDCQGVQFYHHNIRQTAGTRLCLSSSSSMFHFQRQLFNIQHRVRHVFAIGPSIKYVRSKLGLFDPLPPCPRYDVTVTTQEPLLQAYFFNAFPAFWAYGYAGILSYFGFIELFWSGSLSYLAEMLDIYNWPKISWLSKVFFYWFLWNMSTFWEISQKILSCFQKLELFSLRNPWVIFEMSS